MAKYSVEDTSLTAIADAIRAKTGKEDALTLDGMAAAVAGLNVAGKNVEFIGLIDRTITEAVSEDVTEVGLYAFRDCRQLTTVDFPNVTSIGDYAFNNCRALKAINSPNVTSIGAYAFQYCSVLNAIDAPNATSINNYAFQYCYKLEDVNLRNAVKIPHYAFSQCIALKSISVPNVTSLGTYAFSDCGSLESANCPKVTNIESQAFRNSTKLATVILSSPSVCTLGSIYAFTSTPIASGTGYIYVPSALVDTYKAATNWSTYADQIRAIEDYPDITGGAA